jgi:hypothetical protein
VKEASRGEADGRVAASDAWVRLRDFAQALARGDTQAALAAARDACLAEPNRAEAHYAYGQAWLAAAKPARAEQGFRHRAQAQARLRRRLGQSWARAL